MFDADRLDGTRLTLRRGATETFHALNGRDVTAGAEDLVIADAAGPVSLAGIVGGEASGSTEATTHVFLECALFDPVVIARAGRRHQISTDARQRFERGIDPSFLPDAIQAATALILQLCGGEAGSVVAAGAEPAWRRRASLRFARIAGLGGSTLPPDQAVAILGQLGFATVSRDASAVVVDVPPWRNDVAGTTELAQPPTLDAARAGDAAAGAALIEPECDLLEEVLRIAGLDTIESVSLPRAAIVPPPALSPRQARTALVRRLLASRGLAECVTYSFVALQEAARFGATPPSLTLNNPIAADLDQMRPTPLVNLALAASRNAARGQTRADLFEIGPGYTQAGQALVAAGLRAGPAPRHWQQGAGAPGALQAKADVWAVLAAAGVPMDALSVTPDAPAHYHPGQSGTVRQGPKIVLAHFGALHPSLAAELAIAAPSGAFEVFLDAVPDPKRRRRTAAVLPSFQPVSRDFAFVVPKTVAAETVLRAARLADRDIIARVVLFDVFEGSVLPPEHKSLGIEVVFQPVVHTMTEGDIETVSTKVIQAVVKATGAQLR